MKSKNPKTVLQKKADRLMQEWGRRKYKICLVCGKKHSCLHHYYPKSTSARLRYDKDNLINLCGGCHSSHHWGNPAIHNKINKVKGEAWLKRLTKKKEGYVKTNMQYYRDIINDIESWKD